MILHGHTVKKTFLRSYFYIVKRKCWQIVYHTKYAFILLYNLPDNKCQPFNNFAKKFKRKCWSSCVSMTLWYILWSLDCRNKKWIWDAATSFCFWGNQLDIKAASYQRISLIHSVSRLQQKAERLLGLERFLLLLLVLLLSCVQFSLFFCNLRLIFFRLKANN